MIMPKAYLRKTETSLAMRDCRIHTAYHEAGHVVVAYWYGWWLNEDGVEIDTRWYTGTRSPALLYTTETRVVNSMAGRIAEHKYHGLGNGRFDDDGALELLDLARRIHRGEQIDEEMLEASGDCGDIALALVEEKPTTLSVNISGRCAHIRKGHG
jgi:hypothetical protein